MTAQKDNVPGTPGASDAPGKPPAKPSKAKPQALQTHRLDDMPNPSAKANQLVAVTDDSDALLSLAVSDGTEWLSIAIEGPLVVPPSSNPASPVDDGAV